MNGNGGAHARRLAQPLSTLPPAQPLYPAPNAAQGEGVQVPLDTLMVGNLAEKSLALSAIFTATWRATAL